MSTSLFGERESYWGGARASSNLKPKIGYSTLPAEQEDRIRKLRQEFAEIDADGNKYVTLEELRSFLNSKMKDQQQFDLKILKALFNKMDVNNDGQIQTDEFILSYVQSEEEIKQRIKELQVNIKENTKTLQETNKKLQESQQTEILNQYGIMSDSVLSVNVIEAQNLKPMDLNGSSDPYCILSCERQRIETRYLNKTLNPV